MDDTVEFKLFDDRPRPTTETKSNVGNLGDVMGHVDRGHAIHTIIYNAVRRDFHLNSHRLDSDKIKEVMRRVFIERYHCEPSLTHINEVLYPDYIAWMSMGTSKRGNKYEQPPSIKRVQRGSKNRPAVYEWIKDKDGYF